MWGEGRRSRARASESGRAAVGSASPTRPSFTPSPRPSSPMRAATLHASPRLAPAVAPAPARRGAGAPRAPQAPRRAGATVRATDGERVVVDRWSCACRDRPERRRATEAPGARGALLRREPATRALPRPPSPASRPPAPHPGARAEPARLEARPRRRRTTPPPPPRPARSARARGRDARDPRLDRHLGPRPQTGGPPQRRPARGARRRRARAPLLVPQRHRGHRRSVPRRGRLLGRLQRRQADAGLVHRVPDDEVALFFKGEGGWGRGWGVGCACRVLQPQSQQLFRRAKSSTGTPATRSCASSPPATRCAR